MEIPKEVRKSFGFEDWTKPNLPDGFWESIDQSLQSIEDFYSGEDYNKVYQKGPLGQTENADGVYKWGTRTSIAVSTAAAAVAGGLIANEVVGIAAESWFAEGELHAGATVYRVFGGASTEYGGYWTTINPTVISNYRAAAGLYPGNVGGSFAEGILTSLEGVTTGSAAASPATFPGSLTVPEVIVPWPATQIRIIGIFPFSF